MPPPFSFTILVLSFLSLLTATATATTTIGVVYTPSNFPTPERVASTLTSLRIPSVHILHPTPAAIRAFAYSNISLILSVPNSLLPSFAANVSFASEWLFYHVLPFHPRAHISLISVGTDVVSSSSILAPTSDPSTFLLPAMRNLHLSLLDLGIKTISVSTSFSFINTVSQAFPPSSAEFHPAINPLLVKPILQFLAETNSSLLIDLYPYTVYKVQPAIPLGFALFREDPFNFRDDPITAARYRNLFDVMVDAVVTALAITGHENMKLILSQTGWPSSSSGENEEATPAYAQMYLKGLISHLKSGLGTPLKKDGVAEVYIYELFDGDDEEANNPMEMVNNSSASSSTSDRADDQHQRWGILYPNMTMKFNLDFSGSEKLSAMPAAWLVELALGIISHVVVYFLLL
ncbi:glucan endo-1,3-beta-glucosidase GI [Coffea eugenioides]|uniref:glucan endo-1,3-beta-glucosidase GI n=1 Tax=Coffea eugenioides TaxID=49369 RepID=UPI000F60DA08|nr:glucan endo-1,3-beta-glucosidase GI [Coffea eugenioides]